MSVFAGIQLPKIIYETSSKYHKVIQVIDKPGLRKLSADGLVQSLNWDARSVQRMVWGKMLKVFVENTPDLKKVLILGLGGGTIQQLLYRQFPGIEIVTVEIDEVMVDVCQKYFDLDKVPNHRVITDDAMRVVASPGDFDIEESYFDAVLIDIYCGDLFPELGKSGTFLAGIKKVVKPGGLVVFNRVYLEHHQFEVNMFIENIENHFKDVSSLIVAGKTNSDNVLIYGEA